MAEKRLCLQERYAPNNACFGCGPANPKGLRVRSFEESVDTDSAVVADWVPEKHHEAFAGILNGGIVGTLLDCHSNWTAARHIMKRDGDPTPPCTVTADFHVRMKRPTPTDRPLCLRARVVGSSGNKISVEATLEANGIVTATCTGTFVAVNPGHPAYNRW